MPRGAPPPDGWTTAVAAVALAQGSVGDGPRPPTWSRTLTAAGWGQSLSLGGERMRLRSKGTQTSRGRQHNRSSSAKALFRQQRRDTYPIGSGWVVAAVRLRRRRWRYCGSVRAAWETAAAEGPPAFCKVCQQEERKVQHGSITMECNTTLRPKHELSSSRVQARTVS